jgi:hypothetical protein
MGKKEVMLNSTLIGSISQTNVVRNNEELRHEGDGKAAGALERLQHDGKEIATSRMWGTWFNANPVALNR